MGVITLHAQCLIMKSKTLLQVFLFLILAALIYMPLFGHLNTLPIRTWDEARVAVNAYEMFKSGNYLIPTYQNEPEMWNTKPPLLLWMQVAWMHIIGVNELAVRLPSAISAFITCLILLLFCKYQLQNIWLGIISIFVLITSNGYIDLHASRTGDYDALLTLFTLSYSLLFYIYLQTKSNKYLYGFFICIALAVLTKSISGLLFLPALLLYCIYNKSAIELLKNRHFYIGIVICAVSFIWYYLLREIYNPGYLMAVYQNELGGRYLNTLDNNSGSFFFYIFGLIDSRFGYWFLLPFSLALYFGKLGKQKYNALISYLLLLIVFYLLVISSAQTKLIWYDVPLYPLMAILTAVIIVEAISNLNFYKAKSTISDLIAMSIIVIGLFYATYSKIIDKTYLPKELFYEIEHYRLSHYLKSAISKNLEIPEADICYNGYHVFIEFYTNLIQENNKPISFVDWNHLKSGDRVIASQNNIIEFITTNYTSNKKKLADGVILFEIK